VAGDPTLGERAAAIIRAALTQPREPARLAREVAAMRARIFREHGDDDPWNLKHARGGLVEAEFLAQFLQLRFAPEQPALLTTSTLETFAKAAALGLLTAEDSRALIRATELYRRLQAVLRLSIQDRFDAASAPPGLRRALVRAAAPADEPALDTAYAFAELQATLAACEAEVAAIFARHCPAALPDEDQAAPP
jgi:glutamate-ammonia-ligase adenylyltransferase